MSNSNLLRRRLMGEIGKVSNPVITPESDYYNMIYNGPFQCSISCQTKGSVIHWTVYDEMGNIVDYNGDQAVGTFPANGVPDPDTAPSGNINKRYTACGIGEMRHVVAYATRDHWITSGTEEKYYYSGAKPPKPTINIYGSTDGYGNYINTDFGSGGVKCYTPVHAKINSHGGSSSGYVTYYTVDGSTPDPTNAGGNNPTQIYDESIDMVKFTNTSQTFNYYDGIVFNYDYYITDHNIVSPSTSVQVTIKAVTVKNGVSSEVGETNVFAALSTIKYMTAVNTDTMNSAGMYKNSAKYNGQYISWDWDESTSSIIVNPLNIPDTYGYVVFTYDGFDDFSDSLTVFGDRDDMYRWHPIPEAPGTTTIGLRKFGCRPVTESLSTRINKFVLHYKVTQEDITGEKKIFLGRKWYSVNSSSDANYLKMYGSPCFDTGDHDIYSMAKGYGAESNWDYDKPDTTPQDYTPNDRLKAWIYVGKYVNGGYQYRRLTTTSTDVSDDNAVVHANTSPEHWAENSEGTHWGTYQLKSETGTDSTDLYEKIYLFQPDTAGEYDIICGYEENESSGHPEFCPFGFINSPFSSTQNYQVQITPTKLAITGGMKAIPNFFMSYVSNWTSSSGLEILFNATDFTGFLSQTRINFDGHTTVSRIGHFAFQNIKPVEREYPSYTISKADIDISNYKKITYIGDFVFYNCLDRLWSGSGTPQNMIERISLPSNLESIGRFFCGFNIKSSVTETQYPCVGTIVFNSLVPPSLDYTKSPDAERKDKVNGNDGDSGQSSDTDRLYVWINNGYGSPNSSKPRKWHYMPFGCFVWNNSSSSAGNLSAIKYSWYNCGVRVIKVPDAYVCLYTEKWCYQYSVYNVYDYGWRREKVLTSLLPLGLTSGNDCFNGNDGSDCPQGSTGKLFSYRSRYDSDNFPQPNKMCIAKGNLTYIGSSSKWYFNENPWGSMNDSANEGTTSTDTRDKFGWGTSGYNHGASSYQPWNHSSDSNFKNYFAYGLSACNLRGNYLYTYRTSWVPSVNWLPDYVTGITDNIGSLIAKDKTFDVDDPSSYIYLDNFYRSYWGGSSSNRPFFPYNRDADWGKNKIWSDNTFMSYKENWWETPASEWLRYAIDDRRTIDGYRFVKAKVNDVRGLILFPDDWRASNNTGSTTLQNLNTKSGAHYWDNEITSSDWNTYFGAKGCCFLPATGRVTGSSTDYSNRGYYWTATNSSKKGYSLVLYFNGYGAVGDESVEIDYFRKNKAMNVRLVHSDMDWTALTEAIEVVTSTYHIVVNRSPVNGGAVTGGGTYNYGDECRLCAWPNTGYKFSHWEENNVQISTWPSYNIEVTSNRNITAVFEPIQYTVLVEPSPDDGGTVTGAGTYTYGQSCTITATPATNFTFVRWLDNGTIMSLSSPHTFTVTRDMKITGLFETNQWFQIQTYCDPDRGSISGGGNYRYGQQCTLTATSNTGYRFDKWTHNGVELYDNSPYTFIVKDAMTIAGVFVPRVYTVTTVASPEGYGTTSGDGEYNYNTSVAVIATPNSGYGFVSWERDGNVVSTDTRYVFTVTGNTELKANFMQGFGVTVSASPAAGGTVTGGGTYQQGQSCTLTATANTGYTFVRWTKNGTQVSTNASYTFTVGSGTAGAYVAVFQANSYTISVSASPSAGGSVTGAGTYTHGQTCTLTATPNTGYTFTKWTKSGSSTTLSTNATYSFTATSTGSYVAHFSANSYEVTLKVDPIGSGTVTGAGNYDYGSSCTVTARPVSGYTFVNWTEDGSQVSTSANYTFTVNGARNLTAHFSQTTQYTVTVNAGTGGSVSGGGTYSSGATCTVTATPSSGYWFKEWTAGTGLVSTVSTSATYTFTVTGNITLNAVFSAPVELTSASLSSMSNGDSMDVLLYSTNRSSYYYSTGSSNTTGTTVTVAGTTNQKTAMSHKWKLIKYSSTAYILKNENGLYLYSNTNTSLRLNTTTNTPWYPTDYSSTNGWKLRKGSATTNRYLRSASSSTFGVNTTDSYNQWKIYQADQVVSGST